MSCPQSTVSRHHVGTDNRSYVFTSSPPARHANAMTIYNHTGLVVTDLERSKRFYEEALGFLFWYEIRPPDEATSKLNCLEPPLSMTASYLVLGGFVLELLHYGASGATAAPRSRSMNEPGLTHLSISVDDIHADRREGRRPRGTGHREKRHRRRPLHPRPRWPTARAVASDLSEPASACAGPVTGPAAGTSRPECPEPVLSRRGAYQRGRAVVAARRRRL